MTSSRRGAEVAENNFLSYVSFAPLRDFFVLEDALKCQFGESNGEREAEVREDFGVDFAEDAERFAIRGERRGAAWNERGVVDGSVFGRPAKFAEQGVDGAAGGGVA